MKKIMMILVAFLVVSLGPSAIADPYADAVISYTEGPEVSDDYDDPDTALGVPEHINAIGNFVSLGLLGEIELAFTNNVILDGVDDDLAVYEVGAPENAEVFVSNDCGTTWVSLGGGTPTDTAVGTTFSFDLDGSGLTWANAVKIVDLTPGTTGFPYAGFDVDAVEALNSEDVGLSIEKDFSESNTGPEDEIGIYLSDTTVYIFEITYSGPDALILDTVPAEFEVTGVVASAGSASYALATNAQGPKAVAKSATIITWFVCEGDGICANPAATLTVTIQTRLNPGKGHGKKGMTVYKPTSCGILALNDGAMAYQVDGECNPILVDGEMVPIVGLEDGSDPLEVEAVCGVKPCTPENLVVTLDGDDLLLDWDDVCEDGEDVVYNVYRDGVLIAEGHPDSDYDDEDLAPGYYCYMVEAVYDSGPNEGNESGKTDPPVCETVPIP